MDMCARSVAWHQCSRKRRHACVGLQWALDIAGGLTFLHSRKPFVLHRDLKPVGRGACQPSECVRVGCVGPNGDDFVPMSMHTLCLHKRHGGDYRLHSQVPVSSSSPAPNTHSTRMPLPAQANVLIADDGSAKLVPLA